MHELTPHQRQKQDQLERVCRIYSTHLKRLLSGGPERYFTVVHPGFFEQLPIDRTFHNGLWHCRQALVEDCAQLGLKPAEIVARYPSI